MLWLRLNRWSHCDGSKLGRRLYFISCPFVDLCELVTWTSTDQSNYGSMYGVQYGVATGPRPRMRYEWLRDGGTVDTATG